MSIKKTEYEQFLLDIDKFSKFFESKNRINLSERLISIYNVLKAHEGYFAEEVVETEAPRKGRRTKSNYEKGE